MNHFIDVNGEPVQIARAPITLNGIQYPAGIFGGSTEWTRAEKLAIGIWEGEAEAIPEGQQAVGWTFTFDTDHVNEVPTLEDIAPQQVQITVEQLAAAIAPPASNGEALVVGRYYNTGQTVLEGGITYDVIQPFLYATNWTVSALGAHLVAQAPPSGSPWATATPYAIGDLVTYNGSTYQCIQAHTSQAGWTPTAVPALWTPA